MSEDPKCKRARLTGKKEFLIETVDLPKINGTPLVKVKYTGICGSDVHFWELGDKDGRNIVLGHEYTGEIIDPGKSCFKKGDKVVGYTQNPDNDYCGTCDHCLKGDYDNCVKRKVNVSIGCHLTHPGAYSEYVTWYNGGFFRLPENVDMCVAALTEPFAVGLHAVEISQIKAGMNILILGGGIIACAVAEWCRMYGAAIINMTEMNDEKIKKIREFGIVDNVYKSNDPEIENKLRDSVPEGYDIVFDAIAFSEPLNMGLKLLKRGAACVMVGVNFSNIPVNVYEVVVMQKRILGSKGHTPEIFKAVIRAISTGRLQPEKYISKKIKIDDVQKEFERSKREGNDFKIVIEFE